MADQQDIDMPDVAGAGDWTIDELINPEYLTGPTNNAPPSLEGLLELPPQAPQVNVQPAQPRRSPTWAQVAELPHHHGGRHFPQQAPSPFGIQGPSRARHNDQGLRPGPINIAPSPPPAPIFRLDMRQDTPLDMLLPDEYTRAGPSFNHGMRMNNWLREPMTTAERTVMQGRVMSPMLPMSPRSLRSPALSVSGQSDRSTRRSRKENDLSRPYRCNYPGCGEGFCDQPALRKHITGVHGRYEDRPYECLLCTKRFRYPKDVDRHQATHKPRKPKHWCRVPGCPYVTKGFPRKDNYDRHMENHFRADSVMQTSESASRN